jgi:hypothetical protein
MANEQDEPFPVIPVSNWWALRRKFIEGIPKVVSPSYVANVIGVSENAAKAYIIPSLIRFGLVEADGIPTPRARKWRDNEQYAEVCGEMRAIYPQELRDLWPGPTIDRDAVVRWFGNRTGLGKRSQEKMAAVYEMLCGADYTKGQESAGKGVQRDARPKPTLPPSRRAKAKQALAVDGSVGSVVLRETPAVAVPRQAGPAPSLHIDIQIHISPESKEEQIEHIFESMARNLKSLFPAVGND